MSLGEEIEAQAKPLEGLVHRLGRSQRRIRKTKAKLGDIQQTIEKTAHPFETPPDEPETRARTLTKTIGRIA